MSDTADPAQLYIELLKRALTHMLYWPPDEVDLSDYASQEFTDAALAALTPEHLRNPQATRTEGLDWPVYAQTMVGLRRLENVQHCVERVIADGIPGDLIEAGVWRGGVAIFMRGLLKAHSIVDRVVYAADSFRGLPPPSPDLYPSDAGDPHHASDLLAVTRRAVERNFRLYELLDDQVVFLKGWFSETLPTVRDRTWAVVRVDGDLYESTMDALRNLYPGLSLGGYLIVDDFAYEPCRKAVEEYRAEHGIEEKIERIDWTGAFWQKAS